MKKELKIIVCLLIFLTIPSFHSSSTPNITYWGYQLQEIRLDELASSPFDLLVIDYSADGSNDTTWTKTELDSIKNENKLLISYISIGEAEDYRYYWDDSWLTSPPDWLDEENSNWEGNYKVKYWDSEWQDIIIEYIDIILEQGFDGVYLDIIDAYSYYEDLDIDNASDLMIEFVSNIKNHIAKDFLIIPQNGEKLIEIEEYRSLISGIGIEDLYYYSDSEKVDPDVTKEKESYLDLLVDEGKMVLTVDYVQNSEKQEEVYKRAQAKGYTPYTTGVSLNKLTLPWKQNTDTASLSHLHVMISIVFILLVKKFKVKR